LPTETSTECKREIEVEIPADVVTKEFAATVSKYQKLARLPGFRRGKVPATILRQRFADDIRTEVVESLVPKYFREETEKQGLKPVSQPRVTDLHVHEGEALKFKASFEIMPEVPLPKYEEIAPAASEVTVGDQEVEDALKHLREQQATYATIEEDRGLQDGDYAQVEVNGHPKPAPAPAEGEASATPPPAPENPIHLDEVLVEVGGTNTVKEFTENLRGAKNGESKTFEVAYPQDFSDQRLAGQTFTYTLSVKGIKRKDLPELNDAFAKEVSADIQTLDDLKKRIREGIEAEKKADTERAGKEKIVDKLVKGNDFAVPESLVEHQIDVRLERGLRALAAQGMRTEDMRKMDFPRLRAGQRDAALREVKTSLMLERIADAEKIEVTDEELDKEIEAVALQARQPVESVRARLTGEGALDRIRTRLRNEKTLDFLYRRPA
jgi:trigger factor